MRHLKADAGFVFNSDMSRVAVVSSAGETLSEEYSFPLVADHFLGRKLKSPTLVTNWCTTRTLDEVAKRHGAQIIKTKVGQAPVIDAMISSNACLGGDGSGSVSIGCGVRGFDGCAAMGLILESMALRSCSSAALAEALPRHHLVKHKVSCRSVHAYSLIRNLRTHFPEAKLSEEDGIRLDWPSGWVHFRASVTEPVVRMIVEWSTREEAENVAMQMRGLIERLVAS